MKYKSRCILIFLCFILFFTNTKTIESFAIKKNPINQESEIISISFATWDSTEKDILRADKIIEAFEKDNPKIKIKYEFYTFDNYNQAIITHFITGDPPDVFLANAMYIATFIDKGIVLPLDGYLEEMKINKNDYYSNTISSFTRNNKLYAIPKDFSPMALFYNKNLFQQAGINHLERIKSWKDIYNIAKKITCDTNSDGIIDQYGISIDKWFYTLCPYIWSFGGEIISEDFSKTEGYLNSDKTVEAIEFYNKMLSEKIALKPSIAHSMGDPINLFCNNKIGMILDGHWALDTMSSYLNSNKIDVGILELPMTNGMPNVIYPVGVGVVSKTKYPREAVKFAKWLCEEKGGYFEILDSHVGLASYKKTNQLLLDEDPFKLEKFFIDSIPKCREPIGSRIADWYKAEEIFSKAIEKIIILEESTKDALNWASKKIDIEILDKN